MSTLQIIETNSAADTLEAGRQFAGILQKGDVVAIRGDLGAGKTCFVKGIAQGLGIAEHITSPTFTLIHEYRGGTLPLFHVDLYRLKSADEVFQIGLEDYLDGEGVTAIEWPEIISGIEMPQVRRISIEITGDYTRRIQIQ